MVKRRCKICKKVFFVKESHAKKGWGKFCSVKCHAKGQKNGKWIECVNCGKKIYRTPRDYRKSKSKKFFCSVSCHCVWENKNVRYGVNSPNWVAGESAYRDLMHRYKIPYKCAKCAISDKRVLVVHHKDGNRKNNSIDNLERLCCNCHAIMHS